MSPLEKLGLVRKTLNETALEREDEVTGILVTLLADTTCFFLGEVGTGKTFLIDAATVMFGLKNFDILLSETTKAEQIFGPLDVPALAQGKQQYKYQDYAAGSDTVFFDEIFRPGPTVLDQLLWLINERKFRDGDNGIIKAPLLATFAAANSIPEDDVLKAIYDRLVLRYEVKYIQDDKNVRRGVEMALGTRKAIEPIFTRDEVLELRSMVNQVFISNEIIDMAIKLRRRVESVINASISDRRFFKCFPILKAHALLNGQTAVQPSDLELLANVFWNEPRQIKKVQALVYGSIGAGVTELSALLEGADLIRAGLETSKDYPADLSALKKLYKSCQKYNTKYARSVATSIRALGSRVEDLIEQRRKITIVRTIDVSSGANVYKLDETCRTAWRPGELRTFGFRHKRKYDYYYTERSGIAKIQAALNTLGVRLEVLK